MYRGETCDECGLPVVFFTRSYWNAPHDLWNEVTGTEGDPRGNSVILCPPCFTLAAKAKGIAVSWRAVGPPTEQIHEQLRDAYQSSLARRQTENL